MIFRMWDSGIRISYDWLSVITPNPKSRIRKSKNRVAKIGICSATQKF
jgi:hypothetical protein